MWKNILEPDRPQMTVWRMRFECWIHKATNTLSEYVILIDFQFQQWLHERVLMLCYTYTVCLVSHCVTSFITDFKHLSYFLSSWFSDVFDAPFSL